MKAYICFILLFACALCASKKTDKQLDPNFRNEIRAKMINCISAADGVSEVLKEHLKKLNLQMKEFLYILVNLNLEIVIEK